MFTDEQRAKPARVWRGTLLPGAAGTHQTLQLMRAIARRESSDLYVIETARSILARERVPALDTQGELEALYRFVRDEIRFTRDPRFVETLQGPRYTLLRRFGDCDDKATALVALLFAIGHPAELRYRAIGADPRAPRQYSHVYVVARFKGERIALDPTVPGAPMGWEYPNPTVSEELLA